MALLEKLRRLERFVAHDLWSMDVEKGVSGARKFLLKELQMMVLVVKFFQRNFLLSRASSLAFTTLLSLIPVLAILFMFFKAFGGKLVEDRIKPLIYEYLTAGIGDNISVYIDKFLNSATVDTLGSIGFIFLLVAVYSILSSIEGSFNAIWHVKKDRSPVEMLKTYLTIVFVTPVLMVLSLWLGSRLEHLLHISQSGWMTFATIALFKVAPFLLVTLIFLFLTMIMPNTRVKLSSAIVGSLVGAFCFSVLKYVFINYTRITVSYNVIYGSIAILPFFMLWIYFSWIIVLLSVQIVFIRQNVRGLKYLEQNVQSHRVDKLRLAFMVVLEIAGNFREGREQLSQAEMSEKLEVPAEDIYDCVLNLEKSGIITELGRKDDAYTVNVPLEKLTIGMIADAVDQMYLGDRKFADNAQYSGLDRLIVGNRLVAEHDELLTGFLA